MAVELIIENGENKTFPAYEGVNKGQGWVDGSTTSLNAANLNIGETALKAWFGTSGYISDIIEQLNTNTNAKETLQAAIDANEADIKDEVAKLDEAYKAADALINSEIAKLQAEDAAIKESITNLQTEDDNLLAYVGTIPDSVEVETVIEYIDSRTQGLVTDTSFSEAVDTLESELSTQGKTIQELQKQIDNISGLPEDFTSFIKSGDTIQLVGMSATQILNSNG